jgi:hypothetical protein
MPSKKNTNAPASAWDKKAAAFVNKQLPYIAAVTFLLEKAGVRHIQATAQNLAPGRATAWVSMDRGDRTKVEAALSAEELRDFDDAACQLALAGLEAKHITKAAPQTTTLSTKHDSTFYDMAWGKKDAKSCFMVVSARVEAA